MKNHLGFRISYFVLVWSLVIGAWSLILPNLPAIAEGELTPTVEVVGKQYDGLWFLGFNMNKDIFEDKNGMMVRQAFNMAIDRAWIVKNIVKDDVVPTGVIPAGMLGANTGLKGYEFNLSEAKTLMKLAGYPTSDKRLKQLTLLHTDGEKTVETAKWVKRYLISLGVDVTLVEVKYSSTDSWTKELKSGKYHMFLMGYKASLFRQIFIGDSMNKHFHNIECEFIPSAEAQEFFSDYDEAVTAGYDPDTHCNPQKKAEYDSYDLLYPLFHSDGDANFTFYRNPRVDSLLDQISGIDPALRSSRAAKLAEVNKALLDDPPCVNLFYITKL